MLANGFSKALTIDVFKRPISAWARLPTTRQVGIRAKAEKMQY